MAASAVILSGMCACGDNSKSDKETNAKELKENHDAEKGATADAQSEPQVINGSENATSAVAAVKPEITGKDYDHTTASGLKYKVIKQGTGKSPKATDVVTVNYEGQLLNGNVFDSSYQRGVPAQFPLNQVIAGWTEGLQLMNEGAIYEFYIPSNLAYGDREIPNVLPANSDLIFLVELIKVQ